MVNKGNVAGFNIVYFVEAGNGGGAVANNFGVG